MAERRMFAKTIIDSDSFLDMPLSTQSLYFHLSMRADDDGFINNPKKIQRMVGCGDDDLKLLMAKKFILVFDSGVIVIKHWKIHNYIRNDRYKPTLYQKEKSELIDKNNKSYSLKKEVIEPFTDTGIPVDNQTVYQMDTQVRLGKDRLGKVNKDILSDCSDDVLIEPSIYKKIIDYLNLKAKTSYRYQTKATQQKIKARLAEGFSEDNFYTVVDKKTQEWLNDAEMQKFLRPETLFGTKFESYLNQLNSKPRLQGGYQRQPVRQEALPDWIDNPVEEKKLSEERQAELQKELDELLRGDS